LDIFRPIQAPEKASREDDPAWIEFAALFFSKQFNKTEPPSSVENLQSWSQLLPTESQFWYLLVMTSSHFYPHLIDAPSNAVLSEGNVNFYYNVEKAVAVFVAAFSRHKPKNLDNIWPERYARVSELAAFLRTKLMSRAAFAKWEPARQEYEALYPWFRSQVLERLSQLQVEEALEGVGEHLERSVSLGRVFDNNSNGFVNNNVALKHLAVDTPLARQVIAALWQMYDLQSATSFAALLLFFAYHALLQKIKNDEAAGSSAVSALSVLCLDLTSFLSHCVFLQKKTAKKPIVLSLVPLNTLRGNFSIFDVTNDKVLIAQVFQKNFNFDSARKNLVNYFAQDAEEDLK
jgi:hypothetical protein